MLNKSLTESVFSALNEESKGKEFTIEYWADELAREEGYGELEYITAKDVEDAIAKKNHQIEVVNSKKENKVIDRAREDEEKKKKRN